MYDTDIDAPIESVDFDIEFNEPEEPVKKQLSVQEFRELINSESASLCVELTDINKFLNAIDERFEHIIELQKKVEIDDRVSKIVLQRCCKLFKDQFDVWKIFLNEDLDTIQNILNTHAKDDSTDKPV